MDSLWTPGSKKQSRPKGSGGLDDLLGDLLDDDVPPKKKTPSQPIGAVKPGAKKQSSKDEDFYSNLAATAEDNLSDVSEADVDQMAKTVADLEDMDADLFGGKFKKKGSIKGGSDRSSKPTTPRRTGTPRSRSTTPRATSPQARVTSPTARVTSPLGKGFANSARGSSPTVADGQNSSTGISTSRQGSGKRRTGGGLSPTFKSGPNQSPIPEQKPGTAPGKMSDIGSASENLKPGVQTTERPGTVPKMKKLSFPDFDEDDPLAGLLSDEEESSLSSKPKKSALKQQSQTEEPIKKQKSVDDAAPVKVDLDDSKRRNIFERPPTRSGGNTETEDSTRTTAPSPVKKKDEGGIFSDDDDFLGGLGIEETTQAAPVVKAKVQEDDDDDNRPARSVMDKLLNKDSVSRHLETPKERREFVLDKKYTNENEDQEDDFLFGGYQPSVVSTSSRPNSRRSVRFQDEDDIFGFDRPPSRGRSPANSTKKPDDMDWLNDVTVPPKPSPAVKTSQSSQKSTSDPKPVKQEETKVDTKQPSQAESKPLERKPSEATSESSSTKKASGADWLGLNDADDEDDDAFSWMKTKTSTPSTQKTSSPRTAMDKRAEWMQSTKNPSTESGPPEKKTTDVSKSSPADWLGLGKNEDNADYLGLGKEVDTTTILQNKTDSPKFGTKQPQVQSSSDLFESPPKLSGPTTASWQSSARTTSQRTAQQFPAPPKFDNQMPLYSDIDSLHTQQSDLFESGPLTEEIESKSSEAAYGNQAEIERKGTNFFGFNRDDAEREYQQMKEQQQANEDQQQFLQQQAHLQEMMKDMQQQYEINAKARAHAQVTFNPDVRSSVMINPPKSLMDAQTRLYKVEIERDYAFSLLEMNKKRFDEEKQAIENSYKSRLDLIEETAKNKEMRLRDENEQLLSQYLTKVRLLEQEKSELTTHLHNKMEEFDREKHQDIERIKTSHRSALDEIKREHEEAMERLKKTKDLQIEAAVTSHDTTKSLVEAVGLIQSNAKDLGELQKKVDSWHSMGLDEREIALRSRDEQLRILQERLNKQQEVNDMERKRLEDLISRLETQLREQTNILDEERWKVKQEQTRLQSLQSSLEEERRLWTEQQARERSNIEKTRESLLEEQKSVLSQLHKERQALAEERTKLNVSQQLQKEDSDHTIIKLSQAKAEFEAVMRAISEEKSKSNSRKQELQRDEEAMHEARRKLDADQSKMKQKEEELIEAATLLKERSEEVDEIFMESQRKFDEGMTALQEAKKIETEDQQRSANIQSQTQMLRLKEKEIAEERLRLSKDKKEVENLKSAMLCPNCRTPALINGQPPVQGVNPVMVTAHQVPQQNMIPQVTHQSPAIQMSLNSVGSITESIKADRSIRMWKMEALKDQKYLEEQSMFLYTLKQMPYHTSSQNS